MRALAPLPLLLVACGGDPCGEEVQWAPFAMGEFAMLCDGDPVEIREFDPGEYLVDLNAQFTGIDGAGAVSGSWTLAFDGALSAEGSAAEVASYEEAGWYRLHVMFWLTQTEPAAVALLDGTEATVAATFTDAAGNAVSGELDLVAIAP